MQGGLGQVEVVVQVFYCVFGVKLGSYGVGILLLIQEKNWQDQVDFVEVYINWGGYVYGCKVQGVDQCEVFCQCFLGVQVVLYNQDNCEYDIFDSDDYL